MLQSINPATGETIASYDELRPDQVENKLSLAQSAFESWRNTTFGHRKEKMLALARLLKTNAREIGEIATKEMGKPITQAVAEVKKCALVCEYYAENAQDMLQKECCIDTDAQETYVRFDPIGIVLAVMPWNYPYWQVMRFIAPAAMAGNVGLLKHASNVQGCAFKMEELFLQAGFPQGIFQNVCVGSSKVEAIVRDKRVRAATLTGSEHAGSQVAMQAGSEIKKTVLELGGSAPFIVFDDANVDAALETATAARLQNCGQSCIAAKRLLLHESVEDAFAMRLKNAFESQIVGDPMDEKTQMGPMVNQKSVDEIDDQVQRSVAAGATIVTGGKRLDRTGAFYAPTILVGVKKGMPTYTEETFGPVFSVITFSTEQEAIDIANATDFGLSASVWTKDAARAERMVTALDHGAVTVNGMVKSDPRVPFGGVKRSGYGRELSHYGIKEFVNIKSVSVY
jgi:succinate-semialdehyde dehydrogenase / glutarate-semialdehyde dehydrogenase